MSGPAELGWDWATRTSGNLSSTDRRRLLAPLVRVLPRLASEWAAGRLGRRGAARVDLADLSWPDSTMARAAEAEARDALTPHVLEHSFRSYVFGLALAGIDGISVDRELAFTACMFHDIQLEHPTPGRCFAVVSGERAERFALQQGASAASATLIGAGIAAHLTPGVAEDLSDLGGFVSAGALVDVTGARLIELDPTWVREVLDRHPRHEFKRHLVAALAEERRHVPDGRIDWLVRRAAFNTLIKAAPYDE